MSLKPTEVEFTRDGKAFSPAQLDAAVAATNGVTDVLVLSHGWNNDAADARDLYKKLLSAFDDLLEIRDEPGAPPVLKKLSGRTFAAITLLWPSKKFADSDLIPGGGSASAHAPNTAAAKAVLESLKTNSKRLGAHDADAAATKAMTRATELLDTISTPESQTEFVHLLRSVLDSSAKHAEDGSAEFFSVNAPALFKSLGSAVVAPSGPAKQGSTSVGSGGAAGLGDMLDGAVAAARRLANFATYYQMKSRAGDVGVTGLAPLLQKIRKANPTVRLHLIGHSFGGRVITAAANAMPDNTPQLTISLLQAAFSHNGLSGNFGEGRVGSFRNVLAKHRASGPIIITNTKNDKAVGIAYPLASRIAHQDAAAMGDENDPYGGMGRNGAQHTAEAKSTGLVLGPVGTVYAFKPGEVYNLKSDLITGHSDIAHPEVAYAVLTSVAAT